MIQRLYILYIKIIVIYTNNLHDRSSSSKSDNANEQSFPRTIYKLRAVPKLIKSMRLTEALLVLRIDLIGLLPPLSPSFSPVSTLSQIYTYIYVCIYSTVGIRSRVTSKRSKWENLAAGHQLPASFPSWASSNGVRTFSAGPRARAWIGSRSPRWTRSMGLLRAGHHWYCAITRFPGVSTTSFEAEWLARRYIKS